MDNSEDKFISFPHSALLNCLAADKIITYDKVNEILNAIKIEKISVTQYLVKHDILNSNAILAYCETKFAVPVLNILEYHPSYLTTNMNTELIYKYRVIPLSIDKQVFLGVSDPTDYLAINTISFHTGITRLILLSEMDIEDIISTHIKPTTLSAHAENTVQRVSPQVEVSDEDTNTQEPIIEFVNRIINDAISNSVSDIHIEPRQNEYRIRFRRDGLLYEAASIPVHLGQRVITRLKIMAQLNIAERRLPQDGRILLRLPKKIDIRINTCPTLHGEKMVLRLLQTSNQLMPLTSLGLSNEQHTLLLTHLDKMQGLILATGPTGSGKTITLYSALNYLNALEKNICTVEDPIEIELYGITQVNINPKIDLDFSTILKTFLRQDPDIMMIGEIRDKETATIAMQAAQTGHLVLSTLHTNTAIETIIRLRLMGISEFYFATSISLLIAQRLLRKLCSKCKSILHKQTYQATGCEHCLHGYKGRTAIFELVPMTEELIAMILNNENRMTLKEHLHAQKYLTLWQSGMQLVESGITSLAELLRVVPQPA